MFEYIDRTRNLTQLFLHFTLLDPLLFEFLILFRATERSATNRTNGQNDNPCGSPRDKSGV